MNTNKANPNQSKQDQSNRDQLIEGAEADLQQVLRNFRSSVHAWSEAELSRPRMVPATHRHSWRFAAAWALGCVVAVGSLTAGLYQHHRSQFVAGNTQQPQVQQDQQDQQQFQARLSTVSEQARQGDENLMAVVDSDVSRPVPSAMEPLAQLMDDNGDQ